MNDVTTIVPTTTDDPRVKPVARQVTTLNDQVNALQVIDAQSYEHGAEILRTVKTLFNTVETSRKKITQPLDEAKKQVMNLFRPLTDTLTNAEKILKRRMVTWKDEQERIAREEQRKADEKARIERERLEREARIAEEKAAAKARAKAEEARRKAEAKADEERAERASRQEEADAEEAERLAAEQTEADKRHQAELARLAADAEEKERAAREENAKAANLRERASMTVAAPVAPAAPKVGGISGRKVWQFEIIDPAKLPLEYTIPDVKRIRRVVNAMGADTNIPGVRVWSESTLAARRA